MGQGRDGGASSAKTAPPILSLLLPLCFSSFSFTALLFLDCIVVYSYGFAFCPLSVSLSLSYSAEGLCVHSICSSEFGFGWFVFLAVELSLSLFFCLRETDFRESVSVWMVGSFLSSTCCTV